MAQLLYQGHGSYRITAKDGTVIYVDPFVGSGYELPADLILVTHEHFDHNKVSLVAQKPDCRIIRSSDALKNGKYGTFQIGDVKIETVEAYNHHHKKEECLGYLLTLDNITLYAAGDTSETKQMKELKGRGLDWALLPTDGVYNMDAAGASKCAAIIGAKHTIPIHMEVGSPFSRTIAEAFHADGRVIVEPGETIEL